MKAACECYLSLDLGEFVQDKSVIRSEVQIWLVYFFKSLLSPFGYVLTLNVI